MAVQLTSQLAALNKNRVHRYANLWQIQRTDGIYLRFTDHNTNISFAGYTFNSAIGFQVSATQREAGLSEQNKEAVGITIPEGIPDGITYEDMRGGKYRNAKIKEWLVDWQYPWVGAIYETEYHIADMAFDGHMWRADLIGQAKYLRMPVGKVYTRNCRHRLGEAHHHKDDSGNVQMYEPRCGFDLGGSTVNYSEEGGMAAALGRFQISVYGTPSNVRKVFSIPLAADTYPEDAFKYGVVLWRSMDAPAGKNAGQSFEIASSTEATGDPLGCEITLLVDTPYDIQEEDTMSITVGCRKTKTDCINRFDNFLNYGGFPDIPGVDRAILIPDVK